ncbi:MAG: hypothetical protein RL328_1228 [Acidobacteriota bacterium]|jgi:VWFA-related protein
MKPALLCLLLLLPLAGQDIRSNVLNVQVPVTVLAKDGRPVGNLGPQDFKLFDNGVEQKFTLDTVDHPVSLVVAVQTNTAARKLLPVVQRAAPLLESLLTGTSGEVAILGFDSTVQTLLPFSTRAQDIRDTFAKLTVAGGQHRLDDAALEGIRLLNTRAPLRRKILILIGQPDGLGSAISTRQVFQQAELNGIMVYALGMKLPDPPGPVVEGRNRLPPEARAPLPMGTMQTATTDVQNGNYAPTVAEMYEIVRGLIASSALETYAKMTGATQQNFSDQRQLETALQRIAREVRSQYLLTFAPASPTPGFHSLSVDVKAAKTDVRSRRAYRVDGEVK